MKRLLIVAAAAFALAGCASGGTEKGQMATDGGTKTELPATAGRPEPQKVQEAPDLPEATLAVLAESEDKTAAVLASPAPGNGTFDELTVRIGGQSKRFAWGQVTNPTYFPRVWTVNLDAEPDEEVVIVRTTDYGTGAFENRIHVLKRDFREMPVEDAVAKVRELAVVRARTGPDVREFSLELGGEIHTFAYDKGHAGYWFDGIVLGNVVDYKVEDGALVAEVSVQVSPGEFPGSIICRYTGQDGEFRIADAKFVRS